MAFLLFHLCCRCKNTDDPGIRSLQQEFFLLEPFSFCIPFYCVGSYCKIIISVFFIQYLCKLSLQYLIEDI